MPTTDLISELNVDSATFMLQQRQEFSRQAGGTPRVADLGPEIWIATYSTSLINNDDAEAAVALINQMGGSLGTFYGWNPRRQYPKNDPDGSILGSNVVTIYALGVDNKSLQLAGLPAGYVISRGDFLCWDQGSSPVHRCLHQFVADGTADAGGILPSTEVSPHIRSGATTGLVVTLIKAAAEMMISPGTLTFPSNGATFSSISFDAIQVP